MVSFHCEKISKDKHRLMTVLDEIPDLCSSCFKETLPSLASRSRNQEEGNWAISPSQNFQKHVQLLGTLSSYNHFPPRKYQLDAALFAR